MDTAGFLSPKANAFSIAQLIDASQYPALMNLARQDVAYYNWDSVTVTRDMEGSRCRRGPPLVFHHLLILNSSVASPV